MFSFSIDSSEYDYDFEWIMEYSNNNDSNNDNIVQVTLENTVEYVTVSDSYCVIDASQDSSNAFKSSRTYNIFVVVSIDEMDAEFESNVIKMTVNDNPSGGSCDITYDNTNNEEIYALSTLVTIQCTNWQDDDSPLSYQFAVDDGMYGI